MVQWYSEAAPEERRTFWSCFGGWALDAFDVQLFSLAIPTLLVTFGLSHGQAGTLSSTTLVLGAIGGWIGGALSDRLGRVRALQIAVAWFSIFTFLCAFAQSYPQLLVLKGLQGLGFGGEWAAGAVLIAETIKPANRGRAMGAVQSGYPVGWACAVGVSTVLFSWLPHETAWRYMFGLGIFPALLILYIRRGLPDRPAPTGAKKGAAFIDIFSPEVLRVTVISCLIGVGNHGGFAVLGTWLPTFLKEERHLSVIGSGGYLGLLIFGNWCGMIASGYLMDIIGRRWNVVLFGTSCMAMVVLYMLLPLSNTQMLYLGWLVGFLSAGVPATLGPLFSELFPTGMRGTGVGFAYNFGRIISSLFPALVGYMSEFMPLSEAIGIGAAVGYGLAGVVALGLPETKGRRLDVPDDEFNGVAPTMPLVDPGKRAT
jgi:MFS family permease